MLASCISSSRSQGRGCYATCWPQKALRQDATGNTDQGSQFTSLALTSVLKNNDLPISMDGKGCWRDNVFVERL